MGYEAADLIRAMSWVSPRAEAPRVREVRVYVERTNNPMAQALLDRPQTMQCDWIPEVLRNNRIANALRVVMTAGELPEHKMLAIANGSPGMRVVDRHAFMRHTVHEIFTDERRYHAALIKAARQKKRKPRSLAFKEIDAWAAFRSETHSSSARPDVRLIFVSPYVYPSSMTDGPLSIPDSASTPQRVFCYLSVPITQYVRCLTGDQLARGLGELERRLDYVHRQDSGRRRRDIESRMQGWLSCYSAAFVAADEAVRLADLVNEAEDLWMDAIGAEMHRRRHGGVADVCDRPRRRT